MNATGLISANTGSIASATDAQTSASNGDRCSLRREESYKARQQAQKSELGASWDRRQRKEKPLDVPSEEQQVNMAACAFRSDCLEMRTEPDK